MATVKEDEVHLKTYAFHGVEINPSNNGEVVGSCPFCGKNKFYINKKEGLFCCKSANDCGKSGNKYTFLEELYKEALASTKASKYKTLSKARGGLPAQAFQDAELAYDTGMGRWIIPIRNEKGSIVNLRVWDAKKGIPMNTAGCKLHLGNLPDLADAVTVFICEGEWDSISMQWLLSKNSKSITDACVIYVPGADQFKEEWAVKFHNKEVILLYDNDEAGKKGTEKTISRLQEKGKCRSLKKIIWPESFKDKFDIRDYVLENLKKPKSLMKRLLSFLEDVPTRKKRVKKDLNIKKFPALAKYFRKHIHLSEDMEDGLLLICSVILSNQIMGEPLWLFIVGPPGGGKTLLLQSFSLCEDVHSESSLGAKTLISGFKPKDGSDPSLLPRLIGNTLILKDYTEIMSKTTAEQEEIYGQLRGTYDGHVHRSYASGIVRVYPEPDSPFDDCRFSILAGVTNAIHGDNRAALGERFLKYQMVSEDYNPVDQVRHAIDNTIKQQIPEEVLTDAASSFVDHLVDSHPEQNLPPVPKWYIDRIVGLSQLVATIRATVSRKNAGELAYRPTPEVATRLSKQLIKLSQCIALTLGKTNVDKTCYSLISRVAVDTCYGWHRDVIFAIIANQGKEITRHDIAQLTDIAPTTAARVLDDLIELRAITFQTLDNDSKGQPARVWNLSKDMKALVRMARLKDTPHTFKILETLILEEKPKRTRRQSLGKVPSRAKKKKTAKRRKRKAV